MSKSVQGVKTRPERLLQGIKEWEIASKQQKDKENKDFIEKFALKKNDDKSILLVEFKSDSEKFKKTDKNYYEDLLLDNASLFIDKSQFEYYDINPKDLGIN